MWLGGDRRRNGSKGGNLWGKVYRVTVYYGYINQVKIERTRESQNWRSYHDIRTL